MPIFVLDTHVLYWHLSGVKPLSLAARQVIDEARAGRAALVVTHVILAELYFLLQKLAQLTLFDPLIAQLRTSPMFRIEALVLNDIMQLANYPEISEMHDRLIAIQSNRLGAVLVTKDANLQASPQVRWVW